jgi:hypothetical protein
MSIFQNLCRAVILQASSRRQLFTPNNRQGSCSTAPSRRNMQSFAPAYNPPDPSRYFRQHVTNGTHSGVGYGHAPLQYGVPLAFSPFLIWWALIVRSLDCRRPKLHYLSKVEFTIELCICVTDAQGPSSTGTLQAMPPSFAIGGQQYMQVMQNADR